MLYDSLPTEATRKENQLAKPAFPAPVSVHLMTPDIGHPQLRYRPEIGASLIKDTNVGFPTLRHRHAETSRPVRVLGQADRYPRPLTLKSSHSSQINAESSAEIRPSAVFMQRFRHDRGDVIIGSLGSVNIRTLC